MSSDTDKRITEAVDEWSRGKLYGKELVQRLVKIAEHVTKQTINPNTPEGWKWE